jgi:hypothetical protein
MSWRRQGRFSAVPMWDDRRGRTFLPAMLLKRVNIGVCVLSEEGTTMRYFTIAFMVLAGACAESVPASDESSGAAESASGVGTAELASTPSPSPSPVIAPAMPVDTAEAAPVFSDEPPAAKAMIQNGELPLRRGYYVSNDTSCGQASNATLMLLGRKGYGLCTFSKVVKLAENQYRVTERCTDNGPAWGRPEGIEVSQVRWTIESNTAFSRLREDGDRMGWRFCEQKSLPDPWRDNDIRDIL